MSRTVRNARSESERSSLLAIASRSRGWSRLGKGLATCLLAVPALPAIAVENPPSEPGTGLSVHGYLSQAYAIAADVPILGIPTEGTTDYRAAALQFRYVVTSKDSLVVQLSHERFGASSLGSLKENVELDWAFYERRFSDSTAVKVGRVQIPLGIYNEIRDVGTLLPFYRPPFSFYGEGAFTSETVDGLVLSQTFAKDSSWALDTDAYYGGWDLTEVDPASNQAMVGRVEDTVGVQLWLNTPLRGLRIGAGASRFGVRNELIARSSGEQEASVRVAHFSVDAVFDRFTTRAELGYIDFRPGSYSTFHVHLGAKLTGRLTANVQAERAHLEFVVPLAPPVDRTFHEDYAVGLNYAFRSNVVLKAEGHWTKGFRVDQPVDVFLGQPVKTRYAIVSLSASF